MSCLRFILIVVCLQFPSKTLPEKALVWDQAAAAAYIFKDLIPIVKQNIRTNLTAGDKNTFDQIDIELDQQNWDDFGTGAFLEFGNRKIVFTIGFLADVDWIDRSYVEASILNVDLQTWLFYMQEFVDWIKIRNINWSLGRETIPLIYFVILNEIDVMK